MDLPGCSDVAVHPYHISGAIYEHHEERKRSIDVEVPVARHFS